MSTPASPAVWFSVPVPNAQAPTRVICVPYAGAGASVYHAWARALAPAGIEARAVQFPGRENRLREAPFIAMAPLVNALADQVAPWTDRPYVLFGHSMGALVSFELVRELRRRRSPLPVTLYVSGATAPQVGRDEAPLHTLPDDALVQEVSRRYQGIPAQVLEHRELLDLILPALRADLTVMETYTYAAEPPLPCAITALSGTGDARVTAEKIAPWGALTASAFRTQWFDGDHFFLHDHRDVIVNRLRAALDPVNF